MTSVLQKIGLMKEPDIKELSREWQKKLRGEKRVIQRQIRDTEREEAKLRMEIKKLAKMGGQEASVRILAKNIVESRKAVTKLYTLGANIDAISMQMRTMAAQAKLGQVVKASGEMMKRMNKLMSAEQTQDAMRLMSEEMMKAGLIQEMMDDAMDDIGDADLDEEVDAEVEKVIAEATMNKLSATPIIAEKGRLAFKQSMGDEEEEEEEEEDEETAALERRLKSLS